MVHLRETQEEGIEGATEVVNADQRHTTEGQRRRRMYACVLVGRRLAQSHMLSLSLLSLKSYPAPLKHDATLKGRYDIIHTRNPASVGMHAAQLRQQLQPRQGPGEIPTRREAQSAQRRKRCRQWQHRRYHDGLS